MKLATIERIHSIQPHPNPEVSRLEVGKIKAWPVVLPKNQFKEGDLVVFIVIDSIVPSSDPDFKFLERQKFRVWNARFKGAPSQGLVCSLNILNKYGQNVSDGYFNTLRVVENWKEGEDVTDLIGVVKYEKPLDLSINGDAKGNFPTNIISITDEDNLLSYPEVLKEFYGEECYLTIKQDGSSATIIQQEDSVRVCSRRLEQKEGTGFWNVVNSYDLPNKLKRYDVNLALQAEVCGHKIQGNPLGLTKQELFVFNIKTLDNAEYLGWWEMQNICKILEIPTVPFLLGFKFDETWTIEKLQKIANEVTYFLPGGNPEGKAAPAEGIVLRPMVSKFSSILGRNLSVKILNQDYKQ